MLICSSTCNNTLNMSDMVISLDWQTFSSWWSADKWQDFSKSKNECHILLHIFFQVYLLVYRASFSGIVPVFGMEHDLLWMPFSRFSVQAANIVLIHLSSTDHAANWSRGGEQSTYQLWWRSHLPEVQTEFLHPQLALPPWAGGLDSGIQPRPKG